MPLPDPPLQGLLKPEAKAALGAAYAAWRARPETFELEGHAPVRWGMGEGGEGRGELLCGGLATRL